MLSRRRRRKEKRTSARKIAHMDTRHVKKHKRDKSEFKRVGTLRGFAFMPAKWE